MVVVVGGVALWVRAAVGWHGGRRGHEAPGSARSRARCVSLEHNVGRRRRLGKAGASKGDPRREAGAPPRAHENTQIASEAPPSVSHLLWCRCDARRHLRARAFALALTLRCCAQVSPCRSRRTTSPLSRPSRTTRTMRTKRTACSTVAASPSLSPAQCRGARARHARHIIADARRREWELARR